MGSPDFAVPSLRALANGAHNIAGVVTQPDRPAGRGGKTSASPVKQAAIELGLPLIQPEKLRADEAMAQLRTWQPDLIIVAAFGKILRADVLDLPPFGCINVHASLLPRWRGAAPVQAAILAGDNETGVTIMRMDAGIDTGPVIAQRAARIEPAETSATLLARLSNIGAELLIQTLPGYLSGKIQPLSQPPDGATYAPILKKEDGRLDFTRPAEELARQVRAFNPWPGAFFETDTGPVKVLAAHALAGKGTPGEHLVHEKAPAIAAAEGVLVLDQVQAPGRNPMSGKAFLSGTRRW